MPFVNRSESFDPCYIIVKRGETIVGFMTCCDHVYMLDKSYTVEFDYNLKVPSGANYIVWSEEEDVISQNECCTVL
jgi:hypothetical protein